MAYDVRLPNVTLLERPQAGRPGKGPRRAQPSCCAGRTCEDSGPRLSRPAGLPTEDQGSPAMGRRSKGRPGGVPEGILTPGPRDVAEWLP